MKLTPLEQAVFIRTLETEGYALVDSDITTVPVLSRKFTGPGFFTELHPATVKVTPYVERFTGGQVGAMVNKNIDTGYLIYIEKGFLVTLEGFTYEEEWPEVINSFELYMIKKR